MANATLNLTQELYHYLQKVSLRETEEQKHLRHLTAQMPKAVMQISPEQGQFMQMLVRIANAKKCIEVGVFTGYSALSVALALPDDGKIIACDISDEWTRIGQPFWEKAGIAHKIDLHIRPAAQTLDQLIAEGQSDTFDFAFIDADKTNYNTYYEQCLALVQKGGLILIDNTLWEGKVIDPKIVDPETNAFQALNEKLLHDQRVDISMLPVGDGITLVRKR